MSASADEGGMASVAGPSGVLHSLLFALSMAMVAGLSVSALLVFLVLFAAEVYAAGDMVAPLALQAGESHRALPGGLYLQGAQGERIPAPLLQTDVDMQVSGMVVRATLSQRFVNTTDQWLEGVYIFPLPDSAAVDHLRMQVGERTIEGVIQERQAAKRSYAQAREAGRKASLIEQERANIFTSSVANIAPGEEVQVEIEYQQAVHYDAGEYSLRFPMVVAPRYIPGQSISSADRVAGVTGSGWARDTDQVRDASRVTPVVMREDSRRRNNISLTVQVNAGFPIERISSRYHQVLLRRSGDGRVVVELQSPEEIANRDFELVWRPVYGGKPMAALFTEERQGEFYHMVMLIPPEGAEKRQEILPREVVLVVDTSGSMHGASMEQARRALLFAMGRLKRSDRFNVIQFNSRTEKLFTLSRNASPENIAMARRYIQNLRADGGTEMLQALQVALESGDAVQADPHGDAVHGRTAERALRQVVLMTDGSVGNEMALFELVRRGLGDSRLFMVGIGSAPNAHLLRKTAQFGKGSFSYIGDSSEVEERMTSLFRTLENPLMRDVEVTWSGRGALEAWPQVIPDLYYGKAVLYTARSADADGAFVIRGRLHDEKWKAALPMQKHLQAEGVAALWARNKIAALMDQMSLADTEGRQRLRDEITATSIGHHLVSKYTSLVAVDTTPTRPKNVPLHKRGVPVHLPAGWSYSKVFGGLPQTATPAALQMLSGILLLLLCVAAYAATRYRMVR